MSETKPVLPPDPIGAVNHMIKLTEKLIGLMDREAMALMKRDTVSFAAVQDEKRQLSEIYQQASTEFGQRLDEFRAVDPSLVDRLEASQRELRSKTLESTMAMERAQS